MVRPLSLQNFSQKTSHFVALNYRLGKIHFLYASIAPRENLSSLRLPFYIESSIIVSSSTGFGIS